MSGSYRRLLPASYSDFPRQALQGSIEERFREVVHRHPQRPALSHRGQVLTYVELDASANALAHLLVEMAAVATMPVALMFRHGPSHTLAQLGVLKRGGFYANLDPDLNAARLDLLLKDLGAALLLCDQACLAAATQLAARTSGLRVCNVELLQLPAAVHPPKVSIAPADPAYIVYTSGSTGPPQGVVVTHENVLHFSWSHTHYMHIGVGDRAAQVCPLWTAASAAEIFPILLNGATLYPCSVVTEGLAALAGLLQREALTMYTSAPVLLRMVLAAAGPSARFPDMRMVRLAGDRTTAGDVALFRRHFAAHCLLRVGLGASEALMYAHHFIDTHYQPEGEVVPVGYAPADMELLLWDAEGREVAPGEQGEIVVCSRYLSQGYWRNPALTAERFSTATSHPGMRLYRSRDLGYRDAAGLLHHLGRLDARVKLNGKMVLLSDIEQALLSQPGISEAVVLAHDNRERGTELMAFVVGATDVLALRRQLAAKLPAELIPRRIQCLDALPLQLNNKINRLELKARCAQALQAPE